MNRLYGELKRDVERLRFRPESLEKLGDYMKDRMEEPEICDALKSAIEKSGLTSYAIAKATGWPEGEGFLTPTQIDRFKKGERPNIRIQTFAKLVEAVGFELRLLKGKTGVAPQRLPRR